MEVGKAAEPMLINTVFDMASLTKPLVTGTAVMILMELPAGSRQDDGKGTGDDLDNRPFDFRR
jgi:hypothetical protein